MIREKTADIHQPLLDRLADDLQCGELVFPTCMNVALSIRDALQRDDLTIDNIALLVARDPLISAKLLRMANCVSFNPSAQAVTSLKLAIQRLGFDVVRAATMVVALSQLSKSLSIEVFSGLSRHAWQHSIRVAALARVLAGHVGYRKPDEAMLAGLVSDLGVFYLLFVAANHARYREDIGLLVDLLICESNSVGQQVLNALDMPAAIVEAMGFDHEQANQAPQTLAGILQVARVLADPQLQWPVRYGQEPGQGWRAGILESHGEFFLAAEEEVRAVEAILKPEH